MQYNTQQKRMPLPEYGRSIQNMVDHALTIEDRAERQRCAMETGSGDHADRSSYCSPYLVFPE